MIAETYYRTWYEYLKLIKITEDNFYSFYVKIILKHDHNTHTHAYKTFRIESMIIIF